jgi:RNA polymerase sigma-70 factor (ECF subfamily)
MPEATGKQFGTLLEPYLDQLFRAAYRLSGNSTDAQDLVQDTCVRAFTRRDAFIASDSPLAWLMRVQLNLFIDGVRRRRLVPMHSLDSSMRGNLAIDERTDHELLATESEYVDAVQRASMKLNRDQRMLLALSLEGFTLVEISELTDYSVGVVQSRLHRARRSLVRHLKEEPGAAERLSRTEPR